MIARIFLPSILVLLVLVSVPSAARAQFFFQPAKLLSIEMSPQQPAPGEEVTLTASSFSLDLDRSDIVWMANNVIVAQGPGVTSARVRAGALGSALRIHVVATANDGTEGSANFTIRPVEIDILWNSDSYVPPFYKGRPLAGNSSRLALYALVRFPEGNSFVPEKDIIYTWSRNSTVLLDQSGRGKSRIALTGPAYRDSDVFTVRAESADRTFSGEAQVRIAAQDTQLILHENHPLFGILFHRAIVGEVHTADTEQKVTAVPYFANIQSPSDTALSYEWSVNDNPSTLGASEPQTLALRTEKYTGPARIALTLTSSSDIFLRAVGSWQLVFDDQFSGTFGSSGFGQ